MLIPSVPALLSLCLGLQLRLRYNYDETNSMISLYKTNKNTVSMPRLLVDTRIDLQNISL